MPSGGQTIPQQLSLLNNLFFIYIINFNLLAIIKSGCYIDKHLMSVNNRSLYSGLPLMQSIISKIEEMKC